MIKKNFVILCCLFFIILAFLDVFAFVDAGRRGVLLFGRNVMPVLFPFFFVSGLLVELDFFKGFRKLGKATPIFALSLLSGYPNGARLLGDLYNRKEITRNEAIKIATYTSTCSPIFVIATLGACFYKSAAAGVLVFTAHSLGALLNGFLYRKVQFTESLRRTNVTKQSLLEQKSISEAIQTSLVNAVQNILAIGGLIIVFFIVTNFIGGGIFISGVLEMTNGVFQASTSHPGSLIIPCAIISFGGICVAMQGFVFMGSFRMPLWFYFLYKVTHAIFSVIFCFILSAVLL